MVNDIGVSNEHALEAVVEHYDDPSDISGREVAGILGVPEYSEFYDDLMKNDPSVRRSIAADLQDNAAQVSDSIEKVAVDGGKTERIESGANALYEKVREFNEAHPLAAKGGAAALLVSSAVAGYAVLEDSDGPQPDVENDSDDYNNDTGDYKNNNDDNNVSNNDEPTEEYTLEEVDRALSSSNVTEDDLVGAYLDGNISEENRDEVYSVFDDRLQNGSELRDMITDDEGNVELDYIQDRYKGDGLSTQVEPDRDLDMILDKDQIYSDIQNESKETAELQQNISQAIDWQEKQTAVSLAEQSLNGTAENVTVTENGSDLVVEGNFSTENGTENVSKVISYDSILENREETELVLENLETAVTLDQRETENKSLNSSGNTTAEVNETAVANNSSINETAVADNSSYTDSFFQELEDGNFDTLVNASEIGQEYAEANATLNRSENTTVDIDEEFVVKGFYDDEVTEREVDYLHGEVLQDTNSSIENISNPLDDEWNGTDNLAAMDLGVNPVESHELLERYNFTRTEVREEGFDNNYNVTLESDSGDGFTTSLNSSQLRTFSPSFLEINNEYENPSEIDARQSLIESTRQQQMEAVTDFSFRYMDENTDAVTNIASMAVNDDRFNDDFRTGLSERITFFNTFDEAWNDRSDAFNFGVRLVDDENIEQARDDGMNLRYPVFSDAAKNSYFFPSDHETLDDERLRNLEEMTDGFRDELREPDIEIDNIDDLDNKYGTSSSSSSDGGNDDSGGEDGSSGDDGDDGSDDGDSGGPPPNGGGGPGGN